MAAAPRQRPIVSFAIVRNITDNPPLMFALPICGLLSLAVMKEIVSSLGERASPAAQNAARRCRIETVSMKTDARRLTIRRRLKGLFGCLSCGALCAGKIITQPVATVIIKLRRVHHQVVVAHFEFEPKIETFLCPHRPWLISG
jgi:hypothetical protein